ncbi:MAG: DNA-binding response regulator [Robiginitomaculum sp.]|nr:MAG: DNA-binding response regulator [Robiginitomaculum sp.]
METRNKQKNKTVIIADDHAIVRRGVSQILSTIANINIVCEAENGLVAISALKQFKPDLLVVDAAMPLAKGIEVLTECRRWSPQTRIILLTGFTSAGLLAQWLNADVDGILLKSCSPEDMKKAFVIVLNGGKFISLAAQALLSETHTVAELTPRETEVLSLIASGHQNLSIAQRLGISKRTVEKHRSSLMLKLDVTSVAELMTYALREGLLDEYKQL